MKQLVRLERRWRRQGCAVVVIAVVVVVVDETAAPLRVWRSWLLMCTRSKYQKNGIALSAYVAQGFSLVTFMTGTDGTMGTVEKKRR